MSEVPGQHAANCQALQPDQQEMLEAKEFLTVNVFKHIPPKLDGCPLEDS